VKDLTISLLKYVLQHFVTFHTSSSLLTGKQDEDYKVVSLQTTQTSAVNLEQQQSALLPP
jgi:hypothetical protein